jgi:serine/threonine-protein kinase
MVDGFLLEEAIGLGGMGAVFRALDTKLDRQVALKLLPPDQASDAEVVPRFYQEGRAAAHLDHENIARVFSIGQDGPLHYIAFEYIEGETVRQRVETSGPLPVSEAVQIALQIAQALVHASQRGVVHRDIKPSNIIITPQGRAKLVDMGLARRFERGGDHGLTQSGMTLGSFDYISPEQARDPRDADVRSDLYSLGCTLFQMLTGRPPFPGGTVVQKLIQHQEDAPADVRMLNPAVPVEISSIIAKLMAKDRDRRYQTPEHLVRDLLGIAGALGLAVGSPASGAWHHDGHRHTWERHLVWLVPAAGLAAVVAALAWWGRDLAVPTSASPRASAPGAARRAPELNIARETATPSLPADTGASGAEIPNSAPVYSRIIPVSSNEDLLEVLATAPRRSVIVLSDDGRPYELGGRAWSLRTPAPLANPDLTIKAEAGVRPILKLSSDAQFAEHPASSLLHFVGGHVAIEGVEFELDAVLPDDLVTAITADRTELTLRGCSFRRTKSRDGQNVAAVYLRVIPPRSPAADRPPAVFVDACHFDGGQTAILAEGSVDLGLRDCTMGPGQPSIWIDNRRSNAPVAAELRLSHTSVLAGSEPVFRFDGSQVRVWIDDSVIAPGGKAAANLVLIDNPRDLTWRGRSNLYGKIGVFLSFSAADERLEPIIEFPRWKETATEVRETGSVVATTPIWDAPDPALAQSMETDNPTRVFLLSPSTASKSDVGARRGPFGSILSSVRTAQRARTDDLEGSSTSPLKGAGGQAADSVNRPDEQVPATNPMPLASTPSPDDPDAAAAHDDPTSLPTMPPMPPPAVGGQSKEEASPAGTTAAAGPPVNRVVRDEPPRRAAEAGERARASRERKPALYAEDMIRSTEQFLAMFNRLGRQGGVLQIATGAEIELPTIVIEGTGRYRILAEPGAKRPLLRFRPSQAAQRSPSDRAVMLYLRSGSLQLEGVDLVVADAEMLQADRVAAVGLSPGTELELDDCTLTLAVDRPGAAVFVVGPQVAAPFSQANGPAAVPTAVIRVRDSFLRSGGDAINVAAGRRLELELANALVSTEASLVHAFGGARPGSADSPAVKIRMEQVTARVKGGLIHLESTALEPELPFASIAAENSILSTANRDDPLFRLDGRNQFDDLGDKIHWEGRKVAYDRIKTYRRDEVARTGVSPRIYDRANWTSAFVPRDDSPILTDVKFLRETELAGAAWKLERDDLRLAPDSPALDTSADVSRIPQPPSAKEL